MHIIFYIPGPLREFTDGQARVGIEVAGATVKSALDVLWRLYPGIRDRLATEQGEVRRHISLFVGNESIQYTGGLATPIFPDAEISIVPAISGG